ncbi:Basigin [Lamellibrachia satsuma]|nr:Basigin [Lamellibrachia satsuma]
MQQSTTIAVICAIVGFLELAKASMVTESNHVHILDGDKLSLQCIQQEGKAVNWSKNGSSIEEPRFKIEDKMKDGQTVSVLTAEVTQKEDEGTYRCQTGDDEHDLQNVIVNIFNIIVTMSPSIVEKIKESATAMCEATIPVKSMVWLHDNEDIQDLISSGNEHYKIYSGNNTLKILDIDRERIGEYICRVTLNKQTFSRSASLNSGAHVKKFDKSKNLVHGDPLTLKCDAWGYPRVNYTWYKDGQILQSSKHISFADEGNATLSIAVIEFSDRGDYTCEGVNEYGTDNSTILVRVKDKLAALWPFLGICAEVIILCTIIFIYEKMRAKKMAQEDMREEAEHMTTTNSNDHKGADDIRQRK